MRLQTINQNVRRVLTAPAVRRRAREGEAEAQNEDEDVETIPLMNCLRTLQILWAEYKFGVGGKKPAKLFTARERGKEKYSYSLWKPFWTLVEKMIRFGDSHTNTIEKIESVYCSGRSKSVTQILRKIRKDKQ